MLKFNYDFELEVRGKGTSEVHASGLVLSIPKDAFSPDTDFKKVFSRWTEMNSLCTASPRGHAHARHPQSIFLVSKINGGDVCARLLGGRIDINDDVTLSTNVTPTGPKGEKLKMYLNTVDKVTIRPRLIFDIKDKITGVPYWDLVLPRNWEETMYVYNTVDDEDFIEDLKALVDLCDKKQVGWGMNFSVVTYDWHFTISSVAPSECFIGKNKMLKHALEDAIEHVKNIGN